MPQIYTEAMATQDDVKMVNHEENVMSMMLNNIAKNYQQRGKCRWRRPNGIIQWKADGDVKRHRIIFNFKQTSKKNSV